MLTPAWTQLRHHPLQAKLWRTRARFVAAACGRGSGKTELARRHVVRMLPIAKPWSDPLYFFALPTYKQARRVAWNKILRLVPGDWVKSENATDMYIETVFGSRLYVMGLDKPQRIEGDQWDGGVIDESCDQRPGVFDLSVLPALSHRDGWCWRIGVPKRVGPGAAEFKEFYDRGGTPGSGGVQESYTWPSSDVLSPEKIAWARENLDARDYAEQYEASWQKVGGLVFWAFNEVLNVRESTYKSELPLMIGSDFNVDPMAWVVAQHVDGELHVLDELFIRNTNTRATLDELHNRYKSHRSGFDFFGDATSRARNTRASESDYVQIRNDRRFTGARVFYPRRNPKLSDRFSATNAMFCNAEGVRRCFVHPRCKNLIRDLTTRAYKEGESVPDDYGDVSHASDALGYIIAKAFKLRPRPAVNSPEVFVDAF